MYAKDSPPWIEPTSLEGDAQNILNKVAQIIGLCGLIGHECDEMMNRTVRDNQSAE